MFKKYNFFAFAPSYPGEGNHIYPFTFLCADIIPLSINLRTKCVFLAMFRPPLPPCTHLYALGLTPPPLLDAYVINGRPLINTANSEWNKHPYQKLLHFVMFYTIGKLFFWIKHVNFKLPKHGNKGNNWE